MMSSLWWATIGCWPGISLSASAECATGGADVAMRRRRRVGYSSPSPNMWPNSCATVVWLGLEVADRDVHAPPFGRRGRRPPRPSGTTVGWRCAPPLTISLLTAARPVLGQAHG